MDFKRRHIELNVMMIGECMIELSVDQGSVHHQTFGGDTLNTAVYLARLGHTHGIHVEYGTAVGVDTFSRNMLKSFALNHVGSTYVIKTSRFIPGMYIIEIDEKGERRFSYWRSESAARKMFEFPESQALVDGLMGQDVIYFSGISLAILTEKGRAQFLKIIQQCKAAGKRIVFDSNFRPALWSDMELARTYYELFFSHCDIVFTSQEDLNLLYGLDDPLAMLDLCTGYGIQEVVLKRGAQSCMIQARGQRHDVRAETVSNVVDTTAAGDSFSAAYLYARLLNLPTETCATYGHRLASTVIRHPGAIIPAPQMPQLDLI